MMESSIFVRLQQENFHQWRQAPDEVAFLRNLHRHVFYFEIELEVRHDDRELEFFIVQRYLRIFTNKVVLWEGLSCEMVCKKVIEHLRYKFKDRRVCVTVSEDNENGARIHGVL